MYLFNLIIYKRVSQVQYKYKKITDINAIRRSNDQYS